MIDWTEYDPLLGYIPDVVIAARIGCHVNWVMSHRQQLGISSRASLGPSRQYQIRMPLELLERLRAEDQRRVEAGWPPSVSGVIRDALEVSLDILASRSV